MDVQMRARGALLGMAVGEALGAPLEGLTQEQIEEKVERIGGYLDPAKLQNEYKAALLRRGVYEDDSQTAIATAEILIRNDGFAIEALRDRMAELGQPIPGKVFGCYRRPHRNLRTAVRRMLGGKPWGECGINSAGASSASRGIPLGVFFRDKPAELIVACVESTLLTHRDPRPCGGTAAIAAVVAAIMNLGAEEADPLDLALTAAKAAREAEELAVTKYRDQLFAGYEACQHQLSDALKHLPELIDLDLEPALVRIIEIASDKASRPITSATKGFSLTAVTSALYFFLTGLDGYADTLVDTIAEGGSSDTLGCLVGGLAGALHGDQGIPDRWREGLRNNDQIALRAELLVGQGDRTQLAPLLLMEAQLTPKAPDKKAKSRRPASPAKRRGPPKGARRGPPPRGGARGGPPRGPGRGGPGRPGGGRPFRPGGPGRPMGRPGPRPYGPGPRPMGGPPRGPGRPAYGPGGPAPMGPRRPFYPERGDGPPRPPGPRLPPGAPGPRRGPPNGPPPRYGRPEGGPPRRMDGPPPRPPRRDDEGPRRPEGGDDS